MRSNREASLPRLPENTRVGGVHLQISDLARSRAYYTEVIGLHLIDSTTSTASLGTTDSAESLVTLHAIPGTEPAGRRGAFGLFHFAILLPDRGALGRFVAHLSRMGIPAGMSDHRVSEAIYLSDPDGLGIEVYADRPRDTWRYTDGQLVMATDPLDVPSLLRAGEGDVWRGAPAGTTMGHIHLHVGDLEDAAAFYHRAVGFDITVSNYPGALFFSAGGYHHHLGTNTWAPGPRPAPDQAQLIEWSLIVPSAVSQAIGERLGRAGSASGAAGGDWTVRDPWGTTLRLRAPTSSEAEGFSIP